MAIEIRTRVNTGDIASGRSSTDPAKTADFYKAPAKSRGVDPEFILREGGLFEEDGFDSVFVPQMSTWADVWTASAWVLAATTRLRVAAAHRVGLQSPTSAARALATLDRLSGGRASIHVITGISDDDQKRDGDFVPKADRYRRADEYLQVMRQWLATDEPFDFEGEFFSVKGAERGVRPVQRPYPTISYGGASTEGLEVAARHADVYAMLVEPLAETKQLIEQVATAAAAHGRSLRIWQVCNHILGRTDAEAQEKAAAIYAEVAQSKPDDSDRAHSLRGSKLEATHQKRVLALAEQGDWHDKALFTGINRLTGGSTTAALVGSPETVADALLDYYDLGIEIFGSPNAPLHDADDRALRRELFQYLREGARDRDRSQTASVSEPVSLVPERQPST